MTPKAAASGSQWLDEGANHPQITEKARHLETYLAAVADGRIDDSELQAQEQRLVALMKDIEPLLDADLHEKVTQLLCELTAYDLMQFLHSMHENRPKTAFRG